MRVEGADIKRLLHVFVPLCIVEAVYLRTWVCSALFLVWTHKAASIKHTGWHTDLEILPVYTNTLVQFVLENLN